MHRSIIGSIGCAFLLAVPQAAWSGVISSYEWQLIHQNPAGSDDSDSGSGVLPMGDTYGGFFVESNTAINMDLGGFETVNRANMSITGYIRGHDVGLGLTLKEGPGDYGNKAHLDFVWRQNDPFELKAKTPTSLLPDMSLIGRFTIQVSADVKLGQNREEHGTLFNYRVFTGVDVASYKLDDDFLFWDSSSHSSHADFAVGVAFTKPGEMTGAYSVEMRTSFWIGDDEVGINGMDTFKLESLKFEDGSTPEDHGFDVVFDSGRLSPNLTAIPEPSTLALWSLMAISGLGFSCRRAWRRAA
ncbi:MAG: hypothetical protein ACYC6N_22625 [Pirellulaceae bacterium]